MKFNPALLKNDKGLRNIVSLVRTFQDLGGWHVQFNVISAETLKDAQNSPEKYPGLMVRVAGYSAYWNDLAKETQDDIISRAEYNTF
jgi:pyruvate-formate lyase